MTAKGSTQITSSSGTSAIWVENSIVAVTYGVVDNITLPLLFEVYKPKKSGSMIFTAASQRLQPR